MPVITLNREAALEGHGAPLNRFRRYFWTMNSTYPCWCGQTDLADFSRDSLVLRKLPDPLVVKNWPPAERFDVVRDESDFYGRSDYESPVIKTTVLQALGASAQRSE